MDDFVMNSLVEYRKKKLVSIELAAAGSAAADATKTPEEQLKSTGLSEEQVKELGQWMKDVLNTKVAGVRSSQRLVDSPAIIVDHESAAFRRMMRYVDPNRAPQLPKQTLEINPNHDIVINLNALRTTNPDLAKLVAEQIFDDALVSAGLLEDARSMLPRINKLLLQLLTK
jgi:HSP90 family molecular chaperone